MHTYTEAHVCVHTHTEAHVYTHTHTVVLPPCCSLFSLPDRGSSGHLHSSTQARPEPPAGGTAGPCTGRACLVVLVLPAGCALHLPLDDVDLVLDQFPHL